jgi:thiol-disulfide isomerase/thioredoxin
MKNYSLAAFALLLAMSSLSLANINIGDTPQLSFTAYGTKDKIDLASLHGKIVVVDFWATWCGPCMAEAAHMVAVNQQYSGKGMQLIGVSLDEDPSALTRVIKEKGFTWPMEYEGAGWTGATPQAWGVNSIPQTFIIGPDGVVLWRGHPAALDQPLADAFTNHPPQLVDPKVMTAATAALDAVDAALSAGESAKAAKALASVPTAASADGKIAERVKTATDKLQTAGTADLASVDPLIEAKNYTAAASKLRELLREYEGLAVADQIRQKLSDLQSNPDVKAAIEADRKAKDAADALAIAKKLQANKQDESAYKKFKEIVAVYPGTTAAIEAADAVKSYESNTAFMTALKNKADSSKAQAALSMADSYKAAGRTDLARQKYQDVITRFPNTPWAQTAQQGLDSLNN